MYQLNIYFPWNFNIGSNIYNLLQIITVFYSIQRPSVAGQPFYALPPCRVVPVLLGCPVEGRALLSDCILHSAADFQVFAGSLNVWTREAYGGIDDVPFCVGGTGGSRGLWPFWMLPRRCLDVGCGEPVISFS